MDSKDNSSQNCDETSCDCSNKIPRREFISIAGLASAGAMLGSASLQGAVAGPFENENDYLRTISSDKKLSPEWVKSLFARGEKETYSGKALQHIGMPVGGLFAGTVYLSGEGQLWLWDIFNTDQEGIQPRKVKYAGKPVRPRDGANYIEPASPEEESFLSFSLSQGEKKWALNKQGFSSVEFEGRYPIGKVTYQEKSCPIKITLNAFSPFIPLNVEDSSLPATVMEYELVNHSSKPQTVSLEGLLHNPVCPLTREKQSGTLVTRTFKHEKNDLTRIECSAKSASKDLEKQPDYGTFTLAFIDPQDDNTAAVATDVQNVPFGAKTTPENSQGSSLRRTVTLEPSATKTISFVVAWHFPNFYARGVGRKLVGHSYAARFDSATQVARYVADNYDRLAGETKRWVKTWYDSTLPYWFLDRTMANTSTLATTTCYRFKNGRFWAWEGVGCCPGTCTHVWHYAQALGRLFPEIEREHREHVDFGVALHKNGGIGMRARLSNANGPADDGQCGRILGALREHQMSTDNKFLLRTWPNIKQALQFLIHKDSNADGMIEGAQPNTLDADWFGKISFLASLYLAALKAGETMATEVGDTSFSKTCSEIAKRGEQSILETYNGEYFTQIEENENRKSIGIGPGCYIDQIFGQTWAHWVGLGCLFDRKKQLSALRALWKYNFVPDVGPFREAFPRGRWYAIAGDAGLLMSTWPKGGQNPNFKKHWQYQYFNECMSGFEWQAAAHMIFEGIDQPDLLQNGLAISRAIHDRYNANLRNPYNEIECSDHYSRAMASFGAYQAACGFLNHGPKGELSFAPRLTPEDFRCAFVTSEGWGTFSQQHQSSTTTLSLKLEWGKLSLQRLNLVLPTGSNRKQVSITLAGKSSKAKIEIDKQNLSLIFEEKITISANETLRLTLS